jgi:hypothetical protein
MDRLDLALPPQLFRNRGSSHAQRQQHQEYEDNSPYQQESLLSLAELVVFNR